MPASLLKSRLLGSAAICLGGLNFGNEAARLVIREIVLQGIGE
jgi:hypothetical protein